MKRFVCLLSAFLIFINLIMSNCLIVYAEKPGLTEENIVKSLIYVASTFGCIIKGDYSGWYNISMDFFDRYSYTADDIVQNNDGSITVPDQMVDDLKTYCDSYIEDCGSYYLIDTYSSGSTMFTDQNGADNYWYTNAGDLGAFKLALNIFAGDKIFSQFYSGGGSGGQSISVIVLYRDCTDLFFVGFPSNSTLSIVTSTGGVGRNSAYSLKYSDSSGAEPFSFYKDCGAYDYNNATTVKQLNNKICLLTNDGRKVKVFKTVASLKNYLQGVSTSSIYVTNNYLNYNINNDNGVIVNKKIVEEVIKNENSVYWDDISNVANDVTNVINNYYTTNGNSMSEADIQSAIDKALQDFLDNLPKPEPEEPTEPETPTETETETETGGEISGNDVSGNGVDGPKTVGLLTKIYNKLSQMYNLLKGGILDALNGIKDAVSGGGVSGNDVSGNDVFPDDSKTEEIMSQAQEAAAPAAELLKTKFPTCIPWDVINVYNVLVADPAPPVFSVPVVVESAGIDEELTIDLSIYDPVFKVCRTLLTILFALFLMKFTVSLTKGGDD